MKVSKVEKTDFDVLGMPVVVNERWPAFKVFCVDAKHESNQTGGLELQCRRDVFEKLKADRDVYALIAQMVTTIRSSPKMRGQFKPNRG